MDIILNVVSKLPGKCTAAELIRLIIYKYNPGAHSPGLSSSFVNSSLSAYRAVVFVIIHGSSCSRDKHQKDRLIGLIGCLLEL